jgi:hypothetical protein
MAKTAFAATVVIVVVVWVGVSARQGQALPGIGTGIVPIRGTVDISNVPTVQAVQQGEWRVAVAGTTDVRLATLPPVSIAAPDFLRRGARYNVVWSTSERELITVTQLGPGAWVQTQAPGRARWINLSAARSVEETQ